MGNPHLQKIHRAAMVSSVSNAVLAIGKIVAGFLSGSLAVISDGLDSAGDVISSAIMVFTARLMKKPPNIKYPYGYDRAESIASKAISFFIFFAGAQLTFSAIEKLISSEEHIISGKLAIIVTAISIISKFILALHQKKKSKQLNSHMLKANARNMQNDILISGGVLAGLFFSMQFGWYIIDLILALAIGIFIMYTAYKIFISSSTELMDGMQDPSIYNKVFKSINNVKGVYNPHRLRIRQIGSQYVVAVDIEVDGTITVQHSHDIAREVELSIKRDVPNVYDIMVHMEPYGKSEPDEKFGISKKNLPDS
ncbi:MAG: cation diffusion facilitator family transporter [Bacteroidales bacterium]|nr:cation diffusion facilitator family transporter [Bacteroidales bacterium]